MSHRLPRLFVVCCLIATCFMLGAQPRVSAGPPFKDMEGHVAWFAANNLAQLGIVRGCDPPDYDYFCPENPTLRHQMAALIVRAMPGWQNQTFDNPFTDPTQDSELWRRVATLAYYDVVVGYQPEVCQAQGKTPPCYGPLDSVTFGQSLLFIGRAMVAQGYWTLRPDDRSIYPQQNGAVGADPNTDRQTLDHRILVTFRWYVGEPLDVWTGPGGDFRVTYWQNQTTYAWGDPAPRGWFVRVLWQVLSEYPNGVLPSPSPSPQISPSPDPSPQPSPTPEPSPSTNPSPSTSPTSSLVAEAYVSNQTPQQNTTVTVYGKVTDNGHGVSGVTIETTWHYKTTTVGCNGGPSGSDGIASCSRLIGNATSGYTVLIYVTIHYNGQVWNSIVSFNPD